MCLQPLVAEAVLWDSADKDMYNLSHRSFKQDVFYLVFGASLPFIIIIINKIEKAVSASLLFLQLQLRP